MNFLLIVLNIFRIVFCFAPIVRVEEGELAGTFYTLPNDRKINAFYGVPYAGAPTFKHRFKEPQIAKPWTGIWNASTLPSSCMQYNLVDYSIIGEEDCLYLNVFTPQLPEHGVSPLMDVMVYLHGGAFMFGTGTSIYPDYLLKNNDVVFVSINYRLGVLGFFSTGDILVPGNNGLKDQVAALKWVHHNIIKFGGNPASITIAGSSAGGASVHYHYLSPQSEGLFQKGISLSGSVLPPWTLPLNVTEKSIHVAALIGCPLTSTRDMIKCLQKRPAKQIVETSKNFLMWRSCPFTAFGPVVEPAHPNAFLDEKPIDMLLNGKVKNLPWLTSLLKDEGLYPVAEYLSDEKLLHELNENWYKISPNLLMYNFSVPSDAEKNDISYAIKKFYFGDKPISKETAKELIQMAGDRLFYNDIIRAIKLHASVVNQNVYCYKFNYRGKYSLTNKYSNSLENFGTSHADDLIYILKYLTSSSEETTTDSAMVTYMTSMIGAFMKLGNPNVENLQWESVLKNKNANLRCLHIHSPVVQNMEEIVHDQTIEFWKNILPQEYSSEVKFSNDEL